MFCALRTEEEMIWDSTADVVTTHVLADVNCCSLIISLYDNITVRVPAT